MNHRILGIVLFILLFVAPPALHASGLNLGVGGRITAGPSQLQEAIVCAATYGPFLMAPFNIAVPGPYFIQNATNGTPRVGGYFLGLYNTAPSTSTCYNPETGVSIPAFGIKIYGVSR